MTNFIDKRREMKLVCLDMENVLWPEVWPQVARNTGVEGLMKTTRDVADIHELYAMREKLMHEHGITLSVILDAISKMEPMEGAVDFLRKLEKKAQFVVLSDTFTQFLPPIREKLGYPTIICNQLEVDDNDFIVGWNMRCEPTKLKTVQAFQSVGIETICAGDSYNDIGMITNSSAGFLFNSTDEIKAKYPDVKAVETYDDLYDCIIGAL